MNNKFRIILILGIVILYGCKDHSLIKWPETIHVGVNIKENSVKLNAEIIKASYDFIYAKNFFVYEDSIMIVLNKPSNYVNFIEFYNIKMGKIINRFITRGNGPGEMLNTLAHIRKNNLYIHDFMANQIVSINIDSVLSFPDYKIEKPIRFSNNVGSPFVTFYKNDQLIMNCPFYFYDKKMGIDNNAPRFIVTDSKEEISLSLSAHIYYTYNVSQGLIVPNQEKNRLIYASCFLPEIEVYDMELNPIKRIIGPDKLKPSYRIDGNQIVFNKIVPYSYTGYYFDKEHLYFSYVGDYFHGDMELKDLKSWILKYDWDGNFIESFDLPEYINGLSKSVEENVFYGRGFDSDGTVVLWRFFLPEKQN